MRQAYPTYKLLSPVLFAATAHIIILPIAWALILIGGSGEKATPGFIFLGPHIVIWGTLFPHLQASSMWSSIPAAVSRLLFPAYGFYIGTGWLRNHLSKSIKQVVVLHCVLMLLAWLCAIFNPAI